MFRGHREPYENSLFLPSQWQETLNKCLVPSRWMHPQMAMKTEHVARDGRRSA